MISFVLSVLPYHSIYNLACPALNDPTDGSVLTSNGNDYQSVATFSCNTGYNQVGDPTRTCQETGAWTGTTDPTCDIVGGYNACSPKAWARLNAMSVGACIWSLDRPQAR